LEELRVLDGVEVDRALIAEFEENHGYKCAGKSYFIGGDQLEARV
jgi:hypothetical protein